MEDTDEIVERRVARPFLVAVVEAVQAGEQDPTGKRYEERDLSALLDRVLGADGRAEDDDGDCECQRQPNGVREHEHPPDEPASRAPPGGASHGAEASMPHWTTLDERWCSSQHLLLRPPSPAFRTCRSSPAGRTVASPPSVSANPSLTSGQPSTARRTSASTGRGRPDRSRRGGARPGVDATAAASGKSRTGAASTSTTSARCSSSPARTATTQSSSRSLTDGREEAPSRRPRWNAPTSRRPFVSAGAPDESTGSTGIATRASVSVHSPRTTDVIPRRSSSPTSVVSAELRRSRSTSVTRRPARASARASCNVVTLLPSPERALVIMIVRAPAALLASSRLTRSVWTSSASGSLAACVRNGERPRPN